ncbi:MAG: hypothetical protein IJM50_03090 [Lachnospiraceae bacterium]|nr:hypothetical protein [Lachnospiraceae bacterium]
MYCYRCNGTLDLKKNTCSRCGTDIRMYKKIVYASNRYYNEGLLKAQARDLSGAYEALKTSIHLYKKNINARNLLGLVAYEMGESAEALKHWVISKNMTSGMNLADRFISQMKKNMRDLDSDAHGIRKYNQALEYAKNGATDMAVIQLKKVISVHTNMVKAYELLALLYIESEKYDQARKILNRCLEVDKGNPQALSYLKELDEIEGKTGMRSVGVVGEEDREQLIIPVRFRDYGSYLANAVYIIAGALLGIAIAWFVIVPGKVDSENAGYKAAIHSYEDVIADLQNSLAVKELESASQSAEASSIEESESRSAESSIEDETRIDPEQRQLPEKPQQMTSWSKNQRLVLDMVGEWNSEDLNIDEMVTHFLQINPTLIADSVQEHYRNLASLIASGLCVEKYNAKIEAYTNEGKIEEAARLYDQLSLIHPEEVLYRFNAGLAYENAGNAEEAVNRYWQVANLFPETNEAAESKARYLSLTGEPEVQGLPAGVDAAAQIAPVDIDALISELPEMQAPSGGEGEPAGEEPGETAEGA